MIVSGMDWLINLKVASKSWTAITSCNLKKEKEKSQLINTST